MIRRLHPLFGAVALLTIATFWLATAASELLGDAALIARVKTAILWGMILLIPAMAGVAASGFRLGSGRADPLVARKRRRMPIIALNGLLVLLPCAVVLQRLAAAGQIDGTFAAIQSVELAAGALNITLLSLSMRDGLALARGRRAFAGA